MADMVPHVPVPAPGQASGLLPPGAARTTRPVGATHRRRCGVPRRFLRMVLRL